MAFLVDFSPSPDEPGTPVDQSDLKTPAFPSHPTVSPDNFSAPTQDQSPAEQTSLSTYHQPAEAELSRDEFPAEQPPQSQMAYSPQFTALDAQIPSCFSNEPDWTLSVFDFKGPLTGPPSDASTQSFTSRRMSLGLQPALFPYRERDYTMTSRKPLGTGIWSSVFHARPCPPSAHKTLTPPPTPTMRRDSTLDAGASDSYAIKVPSNTSARAVLTTEAVILSYLNCLPRSEQHVVPFHGQDPRNGALVLDALPTTLEHYTDMLNLMSESERAAELAEVFPNIALECAKGLQFLHAAGVIHADIKPSNILLRPLPRRTSTGRVLYQPLFADFSSAFRPAAIDATSNMAQPICPLGGGSWDFLAPALLNPRRPAEPSSQTDVHALAITLLYVIIGHSPFTSAGVNAFIRREMVKQGRAMDCVTNDVMCSRRLRNLEVSLHWLRGNVQEWLDEGLWDCDENSGVDSSKWLRLLKERIGARPEARLS